jgi:IPT/TIG domain-containing protein
MARALSFLAVTLTLACFVFVAPTKAQSDPGGLRAASDFLGFGTGCDDCAPLISTNTAGRTGQVCRVNSLSGEVSGGGIQFGTSGTRSFADCVAPRSGCDGTAANCARIVIFEISGEICLNDTLTISSSYLHIAGQTAPSPGIAIRCAPIHVSGHDYFFQHLRIRGDTGGDFGAAPVTGSGGNPSQSIPLLLGGGDQWTYNVVLDHLSVAFANGYMSIAVADLEDASEPNPWDVSVLDSIVAWPLSVDPTSVEFLGYGIGFWGTNNVQNTAARNLVLHSAHRNLRGEYGRFQFVNNFIYGSGPNETWGVGITYGTVGGAGACSGFGDEGPECQTTVLGINNRFVDSRGTGTGTDPSTLGSNAGHKFWHWWFNSDNVNLRGDRVYLSGNDGENETGTTGDDQLADVDWPVSSFTYAQIGLGSPPSWHSNMSWTPVATASLDEALTLTAGARPADRDEVDELAITQMNAAAVGSRTGSRIRQPGDLGITLTWAVNTHALTTPANPNTVADGAGRTNIELWLESLAETVEDGINISGISPSTADIGANVTITGTGFGSLQGPATVKFNGTSAMCSAWSKTSLTCTVPVGATTGNVVVTQLGINSDNENFTVGVEDPPVPTIRLRFVRMWQALSGWLG